MTDFINYVIELNVLLLFFTGVYFYLFRKETNFVFRRNIILIGTTLAIAVPLISVNERSAIVPIPKSITETTAQLSTYVLEGITVSADSQSNINWIKPIFWLGALITFFLLVRVLLGIILIFRLITSKKSKKYEASGMLVIEHPKTKGVFTFFNYLFIPTKEKLTLEVIAHERVHSKDLHTLDILIYSILKAFFWMNPVFWFLKKELQNLHEFIADQKTIKQFDVNAYTKLLLSQAVPGLQLSVGHYLNKSLTLKRLQMMKVKKLPVQTWKVYSASLLIGVFSILVSCADDAVEDLDNILETATQLEIPNEMRADLQRLQSENPEADFGYVEFDLSAEKSAQNLKELDPKTIALVRVYKDRQTAGVLFNKNNVPLNRSEFESTSTLNTNDSEVFTIVDETATPKEGMSEYYKYIKENLQYPEQAKKLGVEGKVYVQFVVDEAGTITNVKTVKGIGAGCDLEAERVVRNSVAWNPPKQNGNLVKQRIILPITFALHNKSVNSAHNFTIKFEK